MKSYGAIVGDDDDDYDDDDMLVKYSFLPAPSFGQRDSSYALYMRYMECAGARQIGDRGLREDQGKEKRGGSQKRKRSGGLTREGRR